MRDIDAAYKDALVEEYESYMRAGRGEEAEHVAHELRDRYGVDVAPGPVETLVERADQKPPEAAVPPAPNPRSEPGIVRSPAKKTAAKKTTTAPPQE